jgi:hypothetical protein
MVRCREFNVPCNSGRHVGQNMRQHANKGSLLDKTSRCLHTLFIEKVSVLATFLTRLPAVLGSDPGCNVAYPTHTSSSRLLPLSGDLLA